MIWTKAGKPQIEQVDDATFVQNGKDVSEKVSEDILRANGWTNEREPNPAHAAGSTATTLSSGEKRGPDEVSNALFPATAAMVEVGRRNYEEAFPNSPKAQAFGEIAGGAAGVGMDGLTMLLRPAAMGYKLAAPPLARGFAAFMKSKPVEAAKSVAAKLNPRFSVPAVDKPLNVAKEAIAAGLPRAGDIPGGKSLPAIGFKNFMQNAGDAAIFNNAANVAQGRDLELGPAELAGGALGGAVGTVGEKKAVNDLMRARLTASKKAELVNYAERETGKKGKQAVEHIIEKNAAAHGTYGNAVTNLRSELDGLNKEMIDFMETAGGKEIPYPTQELAGKIDNFMLGHNDMRALGNKHNLAHADAAGEALDEYLQQVWVDRMMRQGQGLVSMRELSKAADGMNREQLIKEIPSLTMRELDWIKSGMQKRSSHYQKSAGAMAREGLESKSNAAAASSINSMMKEISSIAENAVEEAMQKNANMLLPGDLQKYLKINQARSKAIGNLKIMEHAETVQGKRDDLISGIGNAVSNANAQNRYITAPVARWIGSKAGDSEEAKSSWERMRAPKK